MINTDRLLRELILALNYSGLDRVFIMDILGSYLAAETKNNQMSEQQKREITLSMAEFQQTIKTVRKPE